MSETVINAQSEVIMHFDLKLEDGSAADSTRLNSKPAKLVMGDGSLTPNFEACLLGMAKVKRRLSRWHRKMPSVSLIRIIFITWNAAALAMS